MVVLGNIKTAVKNIFLVVIKIDFFAKIIFTGKGQPEFWQLSIEKKIGNVFKYYNKNIKNRIVMWSYRLFSTIFTTFSPVMKKTSLKFYIRAFFKNSCNWRGCSSVSESQGYWLCTRFNSRCQKTINETFEDGHFFGFYMLPIRMHVYNHRYKNKQQFIEQTYRKVDRLYFWLIHRFS